MTDLPEQVYDAAKQAYEAQLGGPAGATFWSSDAFRAAVESAWRAGYGQGRDDEAAGL